MTGEVRSLPEVDVATGTNEPRLDMCVYSSAAFGGSGALYARPSGRGKESWNGRRRCDNRKEELPLDSAGGKLRARSIPWAATTVDLAAVVSNTTWGDPGSSVRCMRTASRICSNAACMSWKYAKKYESFSPLSTILTSIVSLKSNADDFSTSTMTG